jgi:succinate-semialdehyde dehydrogenase/glutarate-semialdehyde dehydrogenase
MTGATKQRTSELVRQCNLFIGREWTTGDGVFQVADKFRGTVVGEVARASRDQVTAAVNSAKQVFETERWSPYERYEVLHGAADLVSQRRDELLNTIIAESGFTRSDATGEFNRCIQTLLLSAEEAKRVTGRMVPIDGAPNQSHRMGYTIRVPVGVVCAITPFNSPLNTVAHKVAPALAAGNTVVLKAASYTPMTATIFCEILLAAGLPPGRLNLVHGSGGDVGNWLLENEDIRFYTFTGSTDVGTVIQRAAGLRRTSLELGSIASTIVCEDADLSWAVPRCVSASFRKAGQVCTSVQRLYVHAEILEQFLELLLGRVRAAKVGDPYDPETLVGPMIDIKEAKRAESWLAEAATQGAKVLVGGDREGLLLQPTIVSDVTPDMRVMREEIFAPVISIVPYCSFQEAIDSVNDTPYGLAAGVFTRDIARALQAAKQLHVGGVHINETSSSRVDLMPYTGAKESGTGREGPKYAIEEMTEERLVTISIPY